MKNANELSTAELLNHEYWMREAIKEAEKAEAMGEVPIGAIVVQNDTIIGRGYNIRESAKRAIGHAELLAIDNANKFIQAWRLEGATLYVTLEPCPMCAGAIINSRVSTVVYGAQDKKAGSAGSLMNILEDSRFNHQPELIQGVLAEECGQKLTNFFQKLRQRNKMKKHKKRDLSTNE